MLMKKTILNMFLIMLFVLLSFQNTALFAQDCIKAVPILKGEISRCTGIIYPEYLVKEHLLLQIKTDELEQKLDLKNETCNMKISTCEKFMLKADKQIGRLNNPPFWKTPTFNFISGVLLSVTSTLVIAYALN